MNRCDTDVIQRTKQIETLRHRILEKQFIIPPRLDNAFLTKFLRTRNWDLEKALKNIEHYYSALYQNQQLLKDLRPSLLKPTLTSGPILFLRNLSNGRRVLLLRPKYWDTNISSVRDVELSGFYQIELTAMDPLTQDNGILLLVDITGLRFRHMRRMGLADIRLVLNTLQHAAAIKLAGIHIVNPSIVMWPLFPIVMPLLAEKLRSRVHIHYSLESLHDYIEPSILPASLGGNLDEKNAIDTELVEKILEDDFPYECFWNVERNQERFAREYETHKQNEF